MIIEMHDGLGNPVRLHASRVLISLDDGTPVSFAVEFQPGHLRLFRAGKETAGVHHFRAGDPDFAEQLRHHGVDRTVLVTTLDPKTLAPSGR